MESRIEEDDDGGGFEDIFSSFSSAPALHQYSHTQHFGGPTSVDDLLFGSQTDQLEHNRPKERGGGGGGGEEQSHATTKLSERFSLDDDHPTAAAATTADSTPVKMFDRFYSSSSDDDDGEGELYSATSTSCFGGLENASSSVQNASKRLDNMIQFLERKLSSSDNISSSSDNRIDYDHSPLLPEFVASGGGTGIFRVPVRAAVHPGRPPCLELRPHPLRESQIGCFLRTLQTITTTNSSQLWAGSERGVRFWDLSQIYDAATPPSHTLPVEGDKETAPFRESVQTTPTMCMVADGGNRIVWSGHRDGRIRCWRMMMMHQHQQLLQLQDGNGGTTTPFREIFSWQAHRGPVFSIVITSYGDLWSGSEGGVIKIWPWEYIEKALSLTVEERHMAALTVARSYIDLKSQVNANGACSNFTSDVKYLLADHSGGKVWSAGYIMFALWDSRSRELLKVFNIDGQNESLSLSPDPLMEDEVKMKFVSGSWKERQQSASNFFQRSRNALMGAAGAVRRVAAKGAFGDDNRRTETLIGTIDGMIWTGCSNGLIVQWDGSGNRLQNFQYHPFAVQCMMTFGSRLWVGYSSGIVQVLDLDGSLIGEWVAHNCAVIDLSVGGGYIFTLANHGGIRGWNLKSPGAFDDILRSELAGKEFLYTRMEKLKILAGTWNVGQGRASSDSLISWIGSAAAIVSIIVIGLQEVEMGAGFLAMSAAKETVGHLQRILAIYVS